MRVHYGRAKVKQVRLSLLGSARSLTLHNGRTVAAASTDTINGHCKVHKRPVLWSKHNTASRHRKSREYGTKQITHKDHGNTIDDSPSCDGNARHIGVGLPTTRGENRPWLN